MRRTLHLLMVSILILFLPAVDYGQHDDDPLKYDDIVYDEDIHTVQIYREGWPLSQPFLNLTGDDKLILEFDDLSEKNRNLSYTLIHCNADWEISDMYPGDYLEGFTDNPLTHYRYSTNTTVPYVHYTLPIPNDEVKLKISGNYVLIIFENGDRAQVLLRKRFIVFEEQVAIQPQVLSGPSTTSMVNGQQIQFDVKTSAFPVTNPERDITAVIFQNGNMDNALFRNTPDAISAAQFSFLSGAEIIFPGSNEFRHFEMTDIRFVSKNVSSITYARPYYNVLLNPATFRRFTPYMTDEDIDGMYLIKNARGSEPDIDADYLNVFFTLEAPFPVEGSDVYVYGGLSGWHLNPPFKMLYNIEQHQYELTVLLKQGHYDYMFVTVTEDDHPDLVRLEGSHYETENNYTIILYYAPPGADYERIIGLRTFNSVRSEK